MEDQDQERGTPGWWNSRYLSGDTPWDTGIVPPELCEIVESGLLSPGRAVDMGCGSGLNSRYLARQGFRVVGMDLALSPLVQGNAAAQAAHLSALFCLADVTAPPLVSLVPDQGTFSVKAPSAQRPVTANTCPDRALGATFALDIGCFHAVPPERRTCYVAALASLLASEAHYLLYAFEPCENAVGRPVGIGPETLQLLAPDFSLRWARHGADQGRPSAWYLFRRR